MVDGPYRFEREEADEGHLYVYHGVSEAAKCRPEREAPAAVVSIPNGAPVAIPDTEDAQPRKPYKRADGAYVHPPECACEWCDEPPATSYAKIGSTAPAHPQGAIGTGPGQGEILGPTEEAV